ncbi:hypothetical protein ACFL5I_01570 [Planctomycetota bacterium]
MQKMLVLWLIFGMVISFSCRENTNEKTPGFSKPTNKDYKRLISQLDHKEQGTQELAQNELCQWGKELVEYYRIVKAKAKAQIEGKGKEFKKVKEIIEQFAHTLRETGLKQDTEPGVKKRIEFIQHRLYKYIQPKILFTKAPSFLPHIYLMDADGGNVTEITDCQAESPAWSPDATKIAFHSPRDRNLWNNVRNIYVVDRNGENIKRLTRNGDHIEPAWSPDGTRIVFQSKWNIDPPRWHLWVMDTDGKNQKNLTEHHDNAWFQDWSPDGTKIIFISRQSGKSQIYIIDADGKNLKKLTDGQGNDGFSAWSPDGTKIAFVSDRSGYDEVYVMDTDGENQKALTKNHGSVWNSIYHLVWSPDGTKIDFNAAGDIYVMDADGKNQKRLTDSLHGDYGSAWSPDGDKILFRSARDKHYHQIYIMDADGKNQKRLTVIREGGRSAVWEPFVLKELESLFLPH